MIVYCSTAKHSLVCLRAQWSVVDYHVLSVTARTAPLKMYQSTQHLASVPTFHSYEFKT